MRKVTITITDRPEEAAAIARALRKFLMTNTTAFVWDNCACGSKEQPRRIVAEFAAEREKAQ